MPDPRGTLNRLKHDKRLRPALRTRPKALWDQGLTNITVDHNHVNTNNCQINLNKTTLEKRDLVDWRVEAISGGLTRKFSQGVLSNETMLHFLIHLLLLSKTSLALVGNLEFLTSIQSLSCTVEAAE